MTLTEMAEKLSGGDLGEVLDDIETFLRRFVVFADPAQPVAVALWVAHTHFFDAAQTTPYLAVTAPAKRAGKTLLLEVLELLARDAYHVVNTSVPALFRLIDERQATLLLDEVDAVFKTKGETSEALRGIINAGHRRGAEVHRMTGPKMTVVKSFAVFSPKALAGIGELPDTITDRSIPIRLQRRARSEPIERFRRQYVAPDAEGLRCLLVAAAALVVEGLRTARPELPEALNDRAQDAWEPLLAIADAAGGDWPARARLAAVNLSGDTDPDDDTASVRLLADIAQTWPADIEAVSSADLLKRLHDLEESPWGDWYGKPLNPHGLARLLRPYGVKARQIRFGDRNLRGWRLADLADPIRRYLPDSSDFIRYTATTDVAQGLQPNLHPLQDQDEKHPNPLQNKGCSGVADKEALEGLQPVRDTETPVELPFDEDQLPDPFAPPEKGAVSDDVVFRAGGSSRFPWAVVSRRGTVRGNHPPSPTKETKKPTEFTLWLTQQTTKATRTAANHRPQEDHYASQATPDPPRRLDQTRR